MFFFVQGIRTLDFPLKFDRLLNRPQKLKITCIWPKINSYNRILGNIWIFYTKQYFTNPFIVRRFCENKEPLNFVLKHIFSRTVRGNGGPLPAQLYNGVEHIPQATTLVLWLLYALNISVVSFIVALRLKTMKYVMLTS